MLIPQVPPKFSIHTLMIKACTFSVIILYLYGPYCGFLQQTCFELPIFMDNVYIIIVRFPTSSQKQSQYFFTIAINCYFISGINLLFNLIYLCSSLLCSTSLNVIKSVKLPSFNVCLGLYTAFPYFRK